MHQINAYSFKAIFSLKYYSISSIKFLFKAKEIYKIFASGINQN
jgi:hypothetical protein